MDSIREVIYGVLSEENPMTVRQVFYQLVSRQAIDKTEAEYKHTVVRLLTEMRRAKQILFDWIADNTRWQRKPITYSSLEHALHATRDAYRRQIWNDQESYVEVWLEKDALAGVLFAETARWDVPLMVTRGYASVSYLYEAADAITRQRKPAYIYYFGDWDPSGRDITRATETALREFAPEAEIHFGRVAVTKDLIRVFNLPTRPTKTTDSRAKNFEGESVEVDALPPAILRQLVRDAIRSHIDERVLRQTELVEEAERETLSRILENLAA